MSNKYIIKTYMSNLQHKSKSFMLMLLYTIYTCISSKILIQTCNDWQSMRLNVSLFCLLLSQLYVHSVHVVLASSHIKCNEKISI